MNGTIASRTAAAAEVAGGVGDAVRVDGADGHVRLLVQLPVLHHRRRQLLQRGRDQRLAARRDPAGERAARAGPGHADVRWRADDGARRHRRGQRLWLGHLEDRVHPGALPAFGSDRVALGADRLRGVHRAGDAGALLRSLVAGRGRRVPDRRVAGCGRRGDFARSRLPGPGDVRAGGIPAGHPCAGSGPLRRSGPGLGPGRGEPAARCRWAAGCRGGLHPVPAGHRRRFPGGLHRRHRRPGSDARCARHLDGRPGDRVPGRLSGRPAPGRADPGQPSRRDPTRPPAGPTKRAIKQSGGAVRTRARRPGRPRRPRSGCGRRRR